MASAVLTLHSVVTALLSMRVIVECAGERVAQKLVVVRRTERR